MLISGRKILIVMWKCIRVVCRLLVVMVTTRLRVVRVMIILKGVMVMMPLVMVAVIILRLVVRVVMRLIRSNWRKILCLLTMVLVTRMRRT